jgi:hypothetical protein
MHLQDYDEDIAQIAMDVTKNWHTTEGVANLITTFAFHLCENSQYTEAERRDILLMVIDVLQQRVDTGKWEESGN